MHLLVDFIQSHPICGLSCRGSKKPPLNATSKQVDKLPFQNVTGEVRAKQAAISSQEDHQGTGNLDSRSEGDSPLQRRRTRSTAALTDEEDESTGNSDSDDASSPSSSGDEDDDGNRNVPSTSHDGSSSASDDEPVVTKVVSGSIREEEEGLELRPVKAPLGRGKGLDKLPPAGKGAFKLKAPLPSIMGVGSKVSEGSKGTIAGGSVAQRSDDDVGPAGKKRRLGAATATAATLGPKAFLPANRSTVQPPLHGDPQHHQSLNLPGSIVPTGPYARAPDIRHKRAWRSEGLGALRQPLAIKGPPDGPRPTARASSDVIDGQELSDPDATQDEDEAPARLPARGPQGRTRALPLPRPIPSRPTTSNPEILVGHGAGRGRGQPTAFPRGSLPASRSVLCLIKERQPEEMAVLEHLVREGRDFRISIHEQHLDEEEDRKQELVQVREGLKEREMNCSVSHYHCPPCRLWSKK